jgi:hypothetical protein
MDSVARVCAAYAWQRTLGHDTAQILMRYRVGPHASGRVKCQVSTRQVDNAIIRDC